MNLSSVADRRASYLAGMSRSAGRGWPKGHLLPDSIVGAGAVIVHDVKEGDVIVPAHVRVVRNRNETG